MRAHTSMSVSAQTMPESARTFCSGKLKELKQLLLGAAVRSRAAHADV